MNKKNQPTARNYSIAALIFALLACIATFFLAIMAGLATTGTLTVWEAEDVKRYVLIGAGLVILGLAVYAILEPDRVRRFFTAVRPVMEAIPL